MLLNKSFSDSSLNRNAFVFTTILAMSLVSTTVCAEIDKSDAAAWAKSYEDGSLIDNSIDPMDENGTVHLPAMAIPQSNALSTTSIAALKLAKEYKKEWNELRDKECPKKLNEAAREELPGIRKCRAVTFQKTRWYKDLMEQYKVDITEKTIGGVVTDIYTPVVGISTKNRNRVLMHLHGGAHYLGSRWVGYRAAPPIAVMAGIKVISVDYRQWPEATHPAAVEDVVTVYKSLYSLEGFMVAPLEGIYCPA